jgi:hypothetical protein
MRDNINIKGIITILNLTTGDVYTKENLVTVNGQSYYADRIMNNNVSFIDFLGIGNGTETHSITSIALNNEIERITASSKSNPGANATFEFTVSGDKAIGNWKELGMFTESVDGTLTNVAGISYTHIAGDNIKVQWEVLFN